jgi:phosphoadenosine phosphosulfate reductase
MQLTFDNKTIDRLSIELIQAYEPPEGYYLGFSGGKDSVVIYDLAKRSGVKFEAHYSVSPIDPPQIHRFIKENYPDVKWDLTAKNFWNVHVMRHGLPTRLARWCCEIIKEGSGNGFVKILGMRRAESLGRSKYTCFSEHLGQKWLLPILNWQDLDIWQYIAERNLEVCSLYREGFTRIGCVLCPFAGKDEVKLSYEKFPAIVQNWRNAADRYIQKRIERGTPMTHKSGEEYFNWWIKR